MEDFATIADLSAFWRTLTSSETTRATVLLTLASNRLRLLAEDMGFDLDEKIADEDNAAFTSVVKWVVMEAVKRALQTPTDAPPVETYSQTAGPYSENYKYSNPGGDLWFKKSELEAIGLKGRQTLGAVKTSITDIYTGEESDEEAEE